MGKIADFQESLGFVGEHFFIDMNAALHQVIITFGNIAGGFKIPQGRSFRVHAAMLKNKNILQVKLKIFNEAGDFRDTRDFA